ncbi:H-2 class I histocompatibility antigen, D-D alpha chain-like [Salminus brasiliensis]|uniref:H-2 class I histocompatibility antigen, D-D alpha chain-like n=1 Tax=Salminus brasiliensis TaxID=930266 RepID=UPI003B830920
MDQRTVILKPLLLLAVSVHLSSAATHCLWYFYNATTPGLDFTEYTAEGRLDGEQFVYCNSSTKNMTLKTEWIKKCVSESLKSETQNLLDDEKSFKDDVVKAMQSFNNTAGVNTVKWMYGCELDDDGTERGYWQCGYDGEVYFSLKINNEIFTVETQSESNKQKWEEIIEDGNHKAYLQNYCITSLQKFVDYRKSAVSPKVEVFQQKDSSSAVVCHATGFFPRALNISWQKNGEDLHEDVEIREMLRNPDGTFQKRSLLTVSPEELRNNKYTCVVQHSSLKEDIRKGFPEHKESSGGGSNGVSIGVVVGVLLLVLIGGVGFFLWKKKSGFKPVSGNSSTL